MLTYLNPELYGRFGNQLFNIACTIGIANKMGYDFGFLPWQYQKYFKNPLPEYREFIKNPQLKERHLCPPYPMPMDFKIVNPFWNSSLKGHMQTEKYFEHCRDVVRFYFDLNRNIILQEYNNSVANKECCTDIGNNTIKNVDNLSHSDNICIHFRGTDYHTSNFPICSKEYYVEALTKMNILGLIIVFSDDIDEAKKVIDFADIYVNTGFDMMDFLLMTKFRNFIISNSTFSWWAAWLSKVENKRVIAPSKWYADRFVHNKNDIYAEGWEIV